MVHLAICWQGRALVPVVIVALSALSLLQSSVTLRKLGFASDFFAALPSLSGSPLKILLYNDTKVESTGSNKTVSIVLVESRIEATSNVTAIDNMTSIESSATVTESSASWKAAAASSKFTAFPSNNRVSPQVSKLPALIADNVFMLDVVWVPPSSKIVLLSMTPKMFFHNKKKHFIGKTPAYNHTFPHEVLKSPITLLPHLTWNKHKIRACHSIRAEAGDGNINDRMYIVECYVNQEHGTSGVLRYKDTVVAELDSSTGKFNAADGYQFSRDTSKSNDTASNNHTKVSIAIKSISHYSPFIPDLMDYYQKQGVQHGYLGLIHPSEEVLTTFSQSLANFPGFVSLGWFDSDDVSFNYTNVGGHVLLKTMFVNSVLWNAKAFEDEFLMVADLDDVLVSMNPTRTSFVEELGRTIDKKTTCDAVISPRVLWRPANLNSTRLGERFPLRCDNIGIYEKSVAVLDNCDFVGIHYHKACRRNTSRKYVDPTRVTLHHYTSLWNRIRRTCKSPNATEVESELAVFQRHGFVQVE